MNSTAIGHINSHYGLFHYRAEGRLHAVRPQMSEHRVIG
jgi:hypothetical protein